MRTGGNALLPPLNWGDPVDRDGEFLLPVGTVTLLLADVEDSTKAWERSESDTAEAMDAMSDAVSEAIGRNHGVRPGEQGEGDSFVAAFARASEAVACALDIQRALADGPLALRIGIHSGEAQRREDKTYVGPAVNRTGRLRDAAHGGQVVLSQATVELVADRLPHGATLLDLGRHRLKDLARAEQVFQLVHADLRGGFSPLRSLDTYRHNLPEQRTPLFGRQREADQVVASLATDRLVTLTGTGGCGKTRLGLHVAARLLDDYPDGVFFADLSTIRDVAVVARVITDALGLAHESESVLVPYLRNKSALVVLDNCEQVVAGCAEVVDSLLAGTSTARVLATSREPLGVAGEVTYRVPSLVVPPDDAPPGIEGLVPYAAAELFCDRARRSRADFEPSPDDAHAIGEICRRLDGVPLAIELAAARVRALTPREIATALGERFRLLTGGSRTAVPRQQTLKASVDWSYDLLTEPERAVFRRLSVFAGDFALEAAREVCTHDGVDAHQVVDLLSLLVDKSLVGAGAEEGESRYRLPETIRQYAGERLDESGETESTKARHRDHYLELAERLGTPSEKQVQRNDWKLLDREMDNVRAAYDFSRVRDDAEAMARTACALVVYLQSTGQMAWADSFAEVLGKLDRVSRDVRADFGFYWTSGGHRSEASLLPYAEEAFAYYREHGDAGRAARAAFTCVVAGWAVQLSTGRAPGDEIARGLAALQDALRDAREAGDLFCEWVVLSTHLGPTSWIIEGIDPERYRDELLEFARRHPKMMSGALGQLASSLSSKGDYRAALALFDQSADADLDARGPARAGGIRLADCLAALGDLEGAERMAGDLLDAAEELGDEAGAGIVHHALGKIRAARGDLEGGLGHFDEAARLLGRRRSNNSLMFAVSTRADRAKTELAMGDVAAADRSIESAAKLAFAPGARPRVALARAARSRYCGEREEAERWAHEALDGAARFGIAYTIASALELIAGAAAEQESFAEAARLFGATDAARRDKGNLVRLPPFQAWYDNDLARVRDGLGEAAFEATWSEGQNMSWRDAVAYAQRGRGERKRPSRGWASLTPTEVQVVDLVAEGLSNKHIAERLFISVRTVGSHLSHVYAKLGITSRTELVASSHRR